MDVEKDWNVQNWSAFQILHITYTIHNEERQDEPRFRRSKGRPTTTPRSSLAPEEGSHHFFCPAIPRFFAA